MSALLAATIVVAQGAAGALWWWAIRAQGRWSWTEVAGMGLALGSVVCLISGVLLRPVMGPWGWSVPVAMTVIVAIARISWVRRCIEHTHLPTSHLVALVVGLLAGLTVIVGNWLRVPLGSVSDGSYADIYFFEAISRSVTQFGPGPSILMDGGRLPYHWFSYGWTGQVAASAGSEPFFALTRVVPVAAAAGLVLLAIAWTDLVAARGKSPRWVPTLAAVLVVFAGYTGALYGSILNFDSPSQSLTTVWLLAFGLAVVMYMRTGKGALVAAIVVLAVAIVGGKISHAAVAAASVALLVVVGLLARAPWRCRALLVAVVAALAMVAAYLLVLRGAAVSENIAEAAAVKASTWQGLDPVLGRWGPVLGTVALILAMSARPAGLGILVGRRDLRADPAVMFALGGFLAGLAAVVALREGVNETWFILAASAPAGALSAVGVGVALTRLGSQGLSRPLAWALLASVPLSLLVLTLTWNWPIDPESPAPRILPWLAAVLPWLLAPVVAWSLLRLAGAVALASQWQAVAALAVGVLVFTSILTRPAAAWTASRPVITQIGVVTPTTGSTSITSTPGAAPTSSLDSDRASAARWLLEDSDRDALVATYPTLSAYLPAVTGLRTYLSGELYQAGLGALGSRAEVERRSALMGDFAAAVDDAVRSLCDAGVDYYWIEGNSPVVDEFERAFTSDTVVVMSSTEVCG